MNAIQLQFRKEQNPTRAVLVVSGEVDLVNAWRIEPAEILRGLRRGATVHIDLTQVTYIDSTGITRLLCLHRLAGAQGVRLAFYVREGGIVHRVMNLIGVTGVLSVVPVPADRGESLGPAAESAPDGD